MSRLGLAALWLAACGGGTGIDLEIHSEVDIDSVELFAAVAPCDGSCADEGVAWLVDQPRPNGQTWVTRQGAQRLVPDTTVGGFVLHLEPDGDETYVPALVIVGYDASGAPVAVADFHGIDFDASAGEHWRVTLEAADPVKALTGGSPPSGASDVRVGVWGREDADGALIPDAVRCVGVQHWTDNGWEGTFVVPEDDLDCDGETIECDDRYFNLNQTANAPSDCFGLDSAGVSCRIGSSPCKDGTSDDSSCHPYALGVGKSAQCVPDELCNACASPFGLVACMATEIRRDSNVGHVDCQFSANAEATPCATGVGAVVQIDLPGTDCTLPELRPLTAPFAPASTSLPIIEGQSFQTAGTGCSITVRWTASTVQDDRVWAILAIQDGSQAKGVRLIPVRFTFDGSLDCATDSDAPVPCDVSGIVGDNVMACEL